MKALDRLLILGEHSTKGRHELSLVKMLVHASTILCYPPSNLCHITFRWLYVGRGYISSLLGLVAFLETPYRVLDLKEFDLKN